MVESIKESESTAPSDLKQNKVEKIRAQVEHLQSRLDKCNQALAQKSKCLQETQARQAQIDKKRRREQRTRLLSHAGGMMEMVGLLNVRFYGTTERDNDQDDLRANLLVGALLDLAHRLSIAPATELLRYTEAGREYRQARPSNRTVPKTNPLLVLNEISEVVEK